MLKLTLVSWFILCLCYESIQGQEKVKMDTLLMGTWRGTSVCQLKNSPCHDENVVYHISKKSGVDTFYVNASKIVNGVEEGMGILPFLYNEKKNQFISTAYGIWTFNIEGTRLEGTLFVRGDLYRKIMLIKQH